MNIKYAFFLLTWFDLLLYKSSWDFYSQIYSFTRTIRVLFKLQLVGYGGYTFTKSICPKVNVIA